MLIVLNISDIGQISRFLWSNYHFFPGYLSQNKSVGFYDKEASLGMILNSSIIFYYSGNERTRVCEKRMAIPVKPKGWES
jgi:hypothetical protein